MSDQLKDYIEGAKQQALQDKIKEKYEQKVASLSDSIQAMEKAGKSKTEIADALKEQKSRLIAEAINEALTDLKVTRRVGNKDLTYTYNQLNNHSDPGIREEFQKIVSGFEAKADADITKAVNSYFAKKTAVSGKTKGAVVAALSLEKPDFDATNNETERLNDVLKTRQGILDKGKSERADIIGDRSDSYKLRTSLADKMTSPEGGKIDDYDDGHLFDGDQIWWGDKKDYTDANNPTRWRLNGMLYAQDIFAGGGTAGQEAMTKGIEEPYKLYYRLVGDSRLTSEDLESGMAMKSYFDDALKYLPGTKSHRVIGTIAGLLRLTDQTLKEPGMHKQYETYLRENFDQLKNPEYATSEEKQLKFLFGLQSPAELFRLNKNWKTEFNKIDRMTDPTAEGAQIDDYPGTFSDNKNNKTRWQLNGYLYATKLFGGPVDLEYKRAVAMFHDQWDGNSFNQEHIERKKVPDGKDGFGLGDYLPVAEQFTKHDQVKGLIAGLLKMTDELPDAEQAKMYRKYLDTFFKKLSPDDSEDYQMMLLSSIRPPSEAAKELQENMRNDILRLMIESTKQHNLFKFSEKLTGPFAPKAETLDTVAYTKLSRDAKGEIDNFIKSRAEATLKNLQDNYNAFSEKNAKAKEPLYKQSELDTLKASIKSVAKDFLTAKGVTEKGELADGVNGKYLETLFAAEKAASGLNDEIAAKNKAVDEIASGKRPKQDLPTASAKGSGGNGESSEKPEEQDPIKNDWKDAERIKPILGDYEGRLIIDSSSKTDKVVARNYKGDIVTTIPNGAEVIRTKKNAEILARRVQSLNFVMVEYKGKRVYIPEEQMYKSEDYYSS